MKAAGFQVQSDSSKACAAQPALYASISNSALIQQGRSLIQPLPLGIIVARFQGSNCSGLQPFKLSENLRLGNNDYAQLLEMYHGFIMNIGVHLQQSLYHRNGRSNKICTLVHCLMDMVLSSQFCWCRCPWWLQEPQKAVPKPLNRQSAVWERQDAPVKAMLRNLLLERWNQTLGRLGSMDFSGIGFQKCVRASLCVFMYQNRFAGEGS